MGQLIPFIIGVCGLVLVVGRWVVRWWDKKRGKGGEKVDRGEENIQILGGLDEEIRDTWMKWKGVYEGGLRGGGDSNV